MISKLLSGQHLNSRSSLALTNHHTLGLLPILLSYRCTSSTNAAIEQAYSLWLNTFAATTQDIIVVHVDIMVGFLKPSTGKFQFPLGSYQSSKEGECSFYQLE
jgi:hypothetical protein